MFTKFMHKVARFVLALFVWAHALFVFQIGHPHVALLAARVRMNTSEVVVIGLIVFLSLLSCYGFGSLFLDALYVYFFPLILFYLFWKLAYKAIRKVDSLLARFFPRSGTETIVVYDIPSWVSPSQLPQSGSVSEPSGSKPEQRAEVSKKSFWKSLQQMVTTPFVRFSLLWCILLLVTSNVYVRWAALVIVLFHIVRALIFVSWISVFSAQRLTKIDERIRVAAEGWISRIVQSEFEGSQESINQNTQALAGLKVALSFLRYRQQIAQWALLITFVVFAGVYVYLAVLFSFAYCGVAKLTHVPLVWFDSLVDSLITPLAFSDLAKNSWLKLLAALHAIFVVFLGIGSFFGWVQRWLASLYTVAEKLNARIQDPDIQKKIEIIAQNLRTSELAKGGSSGSTPS